MQSGSTSTGEPGTQPAGWDQLQGTESEFVGERDHDRSQSTSEDESGSESGVCVPDHSVWEQLPQEQPAVDPFAGLDPIRAAALHATWFGKGGRFVRRCFV